MLQIQNKTLRRKSEFIDESNFWLAAFSHRIDTLRNITSHSIHSTYNEQKLLLYKMYLQVLIIKQLGLLFGGERVMSTDITSGQKIKAPQKPLAVSIFGRPVCSPVDGLYWRSRKQTGGALVG